MRFGFKGFYVFLFYMKYILGGGTFINFLILLWGVVILSSRLLVLGGGEDRPSYNRVG